jgi:hypothetical protein
MSAWNWQEHLQKEIKKIEDSELFIARDCDLNSLDAQGTYDEELGIHTVSLPEFDVYGEGESEVDAIESLVDAMVELSTIYKEKPSLIKRESKVKRAHIFWLIGCKGDREKIKEVIRFKKDINLGEK